MNFTYAVTEPPDGQWGAIRPDGTWTGMVGMLQEKKVDFCMLISNYNCTLTIIVNLLQVSLISR